MYATTSIRFSLLRVLLFFDIIHCAFLFVWCVCCVWKRNLADSSALQEVIREEVWSEAGVHVLLHQGGGDGADAGAHSECDDGA